MKSVSRCTTEREALDRVALWLTDKDGSYRNMNLWEALGWTMEEYYAWGENKQNVPDNLDSS